MSDIINSTEVSGLDDLPPPYDDLAARLKSTAATLLGSRLEPEALWRWQKSAILPNYANWMQLGWSDAFTHDRRGGKVGIAARLWQGYIVPLTASLTDIDNRRPLELADRLSGRRLDATMLRLLDSALVEGDGSTLRRTTVVRANLPVALRALRRCGRAGAFSADGLADLIEHHIDALITPGYAGEPVDTPGRAAARLVFQAYAESRVTLLNQAAVTRFSGTAAD